MSFLTSGASPASDSSTRAVCTGKRAHVLCPWGAPGPATCPSHLKLEGEEYGRMQREQSRGPWLSPRSPQLLCTQQDPGADSDSAPAPAGLPQGLLRRPGPDRDLREEPGPLRRVLEGPAGAVAEDVPVQPGAGCRHQRACSSPGAAGVAHCGPALGWVDTALRKEGGSQGDPQRSACLYRRGEKRGPRGGAECGDGSQGLWSPLGDIALA